MDRPDTFREAEVIVGADAVQTLSFFDALQSRDEPVVLFTPALLFTYGGFDRDPVVEFDARFPAESADARPFCVDLTREHEFFFSGFGIMPSPGRQRSVNWDKRVYGIVASRKEECFEFLGGIAFSNPKIAMFANSLQHDVVVPDPTSRSGQVITVTVFGVMSNKDVVYAVTRPGFPARVQRVKMSAQEQIPTAIREAGLLGGFTGEDPLSMRD
jgi:hypothetical protein